MAELMNHQRIGSLDINDAYVYGDTNCSKMQKMQDSVLFWLMRDDPTVDDGDLSTIRMAFASCHTLIKPHDR